jgi:serine/threonine protein kinase/tetratricopeptide (TPR) repeat protein
MTHLTDARTDPDVQLDVVLGAYYDSVAAGEEPDRLAWIARHPEFAADLAAYFIEQDRLHRLAGSLRAAIPPGPEPDSRTLGDYELLEEIARGGMGVVYKARQMSLQRVVALKLILSGEFASPGDVQRFRAEAEAVAQLGHPNIVPIYEVGSHHGRHYFSMKLFEGGSLADHLNRYRADPRAAAGLMVTVARAVHHAHQRGVLHRDLKPSNILLDSDGQPHVVDFGLAKRVGGDRELTGSGALLGSPPYMAPEQASGRRGVVTTATDIYGIGAILYTLLTGRPPMLADSVAATIAMLADREPDRPSRLSPRVDRDLEAICLKCLEKDPARRYGSADAVAEDLRRWPAGETIAARRPSRFERCRRWCRRNPLIASLSTTVALLTATLLMGSLAALIRIAREQSATASALADARVSARAATRAQQRAEAHLRRATASLSGLLMRLQDRTLADSPALAELRRDASTDVLDLFRGFLSDAGRDADHSLEDGIIHVHLAGIHYLRREMAQTEADYREAIRIFEGLVAAHPEDAIGQLELAEACNHLGQHLHVTNRRREASEWLDRARGIYLRALALGPDNVRVLKVVSRSFLRCWDRRIRDPARAAALAREAIRLAPEDGKAWYRLGAALAIEGDCDAAVAAIGESIRLRDSRLLDSDGLDLAIAHARRGDLRQARSWFHRAAAWIDRYAARDPDYLLQRDEAAALLDELRRGGKK